MSASLPKLVHPTIEEGSPSSEMNRQLELAVSTYLNDVPILTPLIITHLRLPGFLIPGRMPMAGINDNWL